MPADEAGERLRKLGFFSSRAVHNSDELTFNGLTTKCLGDFLDGVRNLIAGGGWFYESRSNFGRVMGGQHGVRNLK